MIGQTGSRVGEKSIKSPISQLNFCNSKKGHRLQTSNKSEELETVISLIKHFKMEGLSPLEGTITGREDFMIKIDLKDAYFSVPLSKQYRKYVSFLWDGDIYQFLWSMFWSGPSSTNIYKTFESSHSIIEEVECSSNNLSGRLLDSSFIPGRSRDGKRHADLHFSTSGIYDKFFKKSVIQPCHLIQFLGIEIDSINLKLLLPQEKDGENRVSIVRSF